LVYSVIDKKPLFARHRPAQAEIMPETVWISDVMGESMADAGIKVNTTTNRRLLEGSDNPQPDQSRWFAFRWPNESGFIIHQRDNPNLLVAFRAKERIGFPNLFNEFGPFL
jgi:hypothetical protein